MMDRTLKSVRGEGPNDPLRFISGYGAIRRITLKNSVVDKCGD
jgi:hypothetical protein